MRISSLLSSYDIFLFADPESSPDCLCGVAARSTKIVGGRETGVNEYPWQVGFKRKDRSYMFCGGSLISNQWVLSAAHCFCCGEGKDDPTKYDAVLGEHDYKDNTETEHVTKDIEIIINHPDYEETDYYINFDFSLIKLKSFINFSAYPHIRPVCLPTSPDKTYEDYDAVTTGWGATGDGRLANKLQELTVRVLSNKGCREDYRYHHSQIKDQMLCAYNSGKDSCQGDSGGPLVTAGHGSGVVPGQNYELIGVVSSGVSCADPEFPGVYARVNNQLDWIRETTAQGWSSCPRSSRGTAPTTTSSYKTSTTTTSPTPTTETNNAGCVHLS